MAKAHRKARKVEGDPVQVRESQTGSRKGAAVDSQLPRKEGAAKPANDEAAKPPLPSRSTAIWLCVTLLNLVLLVFLVPESLLKDQRVDFLVKAVPVAAGLFVAGYVWIKAHFLDFLAHGSYKIVQTALLSVLILLHASQFPIVRITPQLEPADAWLGVDGSEPGPYNGGLRVSVRDHTVKVVKIMPRQRTIEREIKISFKDMLAAIFTNYSPRWPLLYEVAVVIQQPGVEVRISKTDGEFDEDFTSRRHFTGLTLPLKLDPLSRTLIYYNGDVVGDDAIELPYGEYVFNAAKVGCKTPYDPVTMTIGKDDNPEYEIRYPACESEK